MVTRGSAEFAVTAVGGGRRGRGPGASAFAAALAVALLVGAGLVSGALFPPVAPSPSPSFLAVVEATPSQDAWTPSPPPPSFLPAASITPSATTRPLSIPSLVAGVLDGSLADKVILVDGRLASTANRCSGGLLPPRCVLLRIEGLRALRIVSDTGPGAWPSDPASDATLVLRVERHDLVFLGSLAAGGGGIPGADYLLGATSAPGAGLTPRPNLVEADGMLLRDGNTICFGSVTSCGQTVPAIVPVGQAKSGNLTYGDPIPVAVAAVLPGVDPANAWTNGPFLLRRIVDGDCAYVPSCPPGASWLVVARETPGGMVSVARP